jgi:hypothetical protein
MPYRKEGRKKKGREGVPSQRKHSSQQTAWPQIMKTAAE